MGMEKNQFTVKTQKHCSTYCIGVRFASCTETERKTQNVCNYCPEFTEDYTFP